MYGIVTFRGFKERGTFGIRSAHHACGIRAELKGGTLYRCSVTVRDNDPVAALLFGSLNRLDSGFHLSEKFFKDLIVFGKISRCADDRIGHDFSFPVHEDGSRNTLEAKVVIQCAGRQKIHISNILFRHQSFAFGKFFIGICAVTDNGSVFFKHAAVNIAQFFQLVLAGIAPGCPEVDHGDSVGGEQFFTLYRIAVGVSGFKMDGSADQFDTGDMRRIVFRVFQYLNQSFLQRLEFFREVRVLFHVFCITVAVCDRVIGNIFAFADYGIHVIIYRILSHDLQDFVDAAAAVNADNGKNNTHFGHDLHHFFLCRFVICGLFFHGIKFFLRRSDIIEHHDIHTAVAAHREGG